MSLAVSVSHAPAPRVHRTVRTPDGLNVAVQEWGSADGPEVLFIHGGMNSRMCWEGQVSDPRLRGLRMVTYDLRGHGDSDKPSDPAFYRDPERWADEVEAVMDVCGLHRPVLVAWSLGGVVTTAYLQKYGTRRLAAVDWVAALAGFGPNMPPSAAFEVGARLASPHLHERIDALRSWLHSCFGKTPPPDVFERMLVNSSLSLPLATVVSPPMVGDWRPVLRAFDRPALISQGDADRITHMDIARGLVADIPNAELSVYEGGGHALFVDEPERFGGELLRLVDRSR